MSFAGLDRLTHTANRMVDFTHQPAKAARTNIPAFAHFRRCSGRRRNAGGHAALAIDFPAVNGRTGRHRLGAAHSKSLADRYAVATNTPDRSECIFGAYLE